MTSRTRLWVLLISTPVIAFAIIGGYLGQVMAKDDTYQHLRVFQDVVSLVLKDSFVVAQADIFNKRDEKQKVYTVRRLQQVEGIWTAMDIEMTNALERSRTDLTIESIDYNVGLKESDFSRRELERTK